MKFIVGVVAAILVAALIPAVFVAVIFAPGAVRAFCFTEDSLEFVEATGKVSESMIYMGEQLSYGAKTSDPYVLTMMYMTALGTTGLSLSAIDVNGNLVDVDPVTGVPGPRQTLAFYGEQFRISLEGHPEYLIGTPAQIASDLTGFPAKTFSPHWALAAELTAAVTGTSSVDLGVKDADEDPCNDALQIYWGDGELQWYGDTVAPLVIPLRITSTFGWRIHPIYGTVMLHAGTDYGADCGQPIVAVQDALVLSAKKNIDGAGVVILQHESGVQTKYVHMRMRDVFVTPGDRLVQGQMFALVGSEGASTACHLHFEVRLPDGRLADSRDVFGF